MISDPLKTARALLCVLFLLAAVSPAAADDLVPPSWRGDDGSTVQSWGFVTSGVYDFMSMWYEYNAPDGGLNSNPYGTATLSVKPGALAGYEDEWGGRVGVWPLTGTIEAEIPNSQIPNPYKEIWIQLTWAAEDELYVPTVTVEVDPCYTISDVELIEQIDLGPTGEERTTPWYLSVYHVYIWENPSFETVTIEGPVFVDQLVIDTICTVPEPATLSLIGLGGAALLLRRRRKK